MNFDKSVHPSRIFCQYIWNILIFRHVKRHKKRWTTRITPLTVIAIQCSSIVTSYNILSNISVTNSSYISILIFISKLFYLKKMDPLRLINHFYLCQSSRFLIIFLSATNIKSMGNLFISIFKIYYSYS